MDLRSNVGSKEGKIQGGLGSERWTRVRGKSVVGTRGVVRPIVNGGTYCRGLGTEKEGDLSPILDLE